MFLGSYQVVKGLSDTHLFPYRMSFIENAVNFPMLPQLQKPDCAVASLAWALSPFDRFIVRINHAYACEIGISYDSLSDGL